METVAMATSVPAAGVVLVVHVVSGGVILRVVIGDVLVFNFISVVDDVVGSSLLDVEELVDAGIVGADSSDVHHVLLSVVVTLGVTSDVDNEEVEELVNLLLLIEDIDVLVVLDRSGTADVETSWKPEGLCKP